MSTERALAMMARAVREARRSLGRTRPNPNVGCVIARGDRIVGVGYHVRAGLAHAEVAALRRAGTEARGADAYVTLEPCSHVGRTGPCADALIAAGVRRVFVGVRDPDPRVDGRGIRRLRAAGIEVQVGLLRAACERLIEPFAFSQRHGRPWICAKVAQSLDGRVATRSGESQWISTAGRQLSQHLRDTYDAIAVGIGTVLADDPQLTCRLRRGRDPIRIVLDTHARLPLTSAVVRLCGVSAAPTWTCVGKNARPARRRALERAGVLTLACATRRDGRLDLDDVMARLQAQQLRSVFVEGGPTLLGALFDAHLVNRFMAVVAPLIVGGVAAPGSIGGTGVARLIQAHRLAHVQFKTIGTDWLICGDVVRGRTGKD